MRVVVVHCHVDADGDDDDEGLSNRLYRTIIIIIVPARWKKFIKNSNREIYRSLHA